MSPQAPPPAHSRPTPPALLAPVSCLVPVLVKRPRALEPFFNLKLPCSPLPRPPSQAPRDSRSPRSCLRLRRPRCPRPPPWCVLRALEVALPRLEVALEVMLNIRIRDNASDRPQLLQHLKSLTVIYKVLTVISVDMVDQLDRLISYRTFLQEN